MRSARQRRLTVHGDWQRRRCVPSHLAWTPFVPIALCESVRGAVREARRMATPSLFGRAQRGCGPLTWVRPLKPPSASAP